MITRPMSFAAQLARTWVAIYTFGMHSEAKNARRDEMESDLWEQAVDEEFGPSVWQAFARLILGMPADLTWRLEQRGTKISQSDRKQSKARTSMPTMVKANWLTAIVVLFAGFAIVTGTSIFVRFVGGDGDGTLGAVIYGLGAVVAGALMLTGFFVSQKSPWRGAALLTLGSVMIAAVHFWMFPIYVPIALVIIGFGVARARKFARMGEPSVST